MSAMELTLLGMIALMFGLSFWQALQSRPDAARSGQRRH